MYKTRKPLFMCPQDLTRALEMGLNKKAPEVSHLLKPVPNTGESLYGALKIEIDASDRKKRMRSKSRIEYLFLRSTQSFRNSNLTLY